MPIFPSNAQGPTGLIWTQKQHTSGHFFCRPVKGKPLKQSTHVHINPFFLMHITFHAYASIFFLCSIVIVIIISICNKPELHCQSWISPKKHPSIHSWLSIYTIITSYIYIYHIYIHNIYIYSTRKQ